MHIVRCLSFFLLFLAGCAGSQPLFHVETDTFSADFYDTQCSSKEVLALTGPIPAEIVKDVKDGVVTFKDATSKRQFCYVLDEDKTSAFAIDETGEQGFIQLKK